MVVSDITNDQPTNQTALLDLEREDPPDEDRRRPQHVLLLLLRLAWYWSGQVLMSISKLELKLMMVLIAREESNNHKKLLNIVPPEPGILLLAMEPFTEEVNFYSNVKKEHVRVFQWRSSPKSKKNSETVSLYASFPVIS